MAVIPVERALISVSNKEGLGPFAQGLTELGVEIISTGGTAAMLDNAGVDVTPVEQVTGFPEMLDGRVKTLHPRVHGGILALRKAEHLMQLKQHDITTIDLVVVNLYPFRETIADPNVRLKDAIENIDIGGPTMVRSAAKNNAYVGVVVDPGDYTRVLKELKENDGGLTDDTRRNLAAKAFAHTAEYDAAIAEYLTRLDNGEVAKEFGDFIALTGHKIQDLRYGENPHQSAAFYRVTNETGPTLASGKQLQGKELSYNNIIDLEGAYQAARSLPGIGAVVIKHTNPCGAATSDSSLADAYRKARATDPTSAFGGIVGLTRTVDHETAEELTSTFLEAVVAPGYDTAARDVLAKKKNIRLIEIKNWNDALTGGYAVAAVSGGVLVQSRDEGRVDVRECTVVSKRRPTDDEWRAFDFAWRMVKHVKSNAILFATKDQLIGVGAGQMSRVDSTKLARMKAELPLDGAVCASDAFFPFRDGLDQIYDAGIRAVIEPGGSVRDEEVVAAADEHDMALVFTGMRHFRH